MTGRLFGVLRDQTVDFIDLASQGHGRAALVAMQEGVDSLFQATIDLAESALVEQVLTRETPMDPLGLGGELGATESAERLRLRLIRCALENAAARTVTGLDHLVNSHLRLAWEVNVVGADELRRCGFDPDKHDTESWSSIGNLVKGLARDDTAACLPAFRCSPPFSECLADADVQDVLEFRRRVIHRARPSHREAPTLGRSSLWSAEGRAQLTVNPFDETPDPELPSLAERRAQISRGIASTLPYVEELWQTVLMWLPLTGVHVRHDPQAGKVNVRIGLGDPKAVPRASRDPGPFIARTDT